MTKDVEKQAHDIVRREIVAVLEMKEEARRDNMYKANELWAEDVLTGLIEAGIV